MTMQKNLKALWEPIAEQISAQVTKDIYQRWFQAVEMVAADEKEITLSVPNNIYQLWIESNYMAVLQSSIAAVLGARLVRFSVCAEAPALCPPARKSEAEDRGASAFGHAPAEIPKRKRPPRTATVPGRAPGMNPRNTFATFVVGTNSQFAHAAALAVATRLRAPTIRSSFTAGWASAKPISCRPLGTPPWSAPPRKRSCISRARNLRTSSSTPSRTIRSPKFRKRYRQADILLIDDIQFFAGKERSQEEFFHTFNTLFDGHKQIVLSSDRPPTEIANLEQRLVSRFEWGLTAELQPPDIETRLAILGKKAETLAIKLHPSVLEFLAQRIRTNVRRLEGALMRVASFASLNQGSSPNTEEIEDLLQRHSARGSAAHRKHR